MIESPTVFRKVEPPDKKKSRQVILKKENNFKRIAFWESGKIRSFELNKDTVKKAILKSGFFASKTLWLNLDPMETRSRYGMRDEQENTFRCIKAHRAKTA